jgi:hypothetical protein
MAGCKTLNDISRNLCYLKTSALPFGGLYFLFTGDLHQLPRIVGDRSLYVERRDEYIRAGRYELSQLQKNYIAGIELWGRATRIPVLLTQYYQATNEGVYRVLNRIRHGRATPADIEIVHSRTSGHPEGPNPTDIIWKEAPLVTYTEEFYTTGMEQRSRYLLLNTQWTLGIKSVYLLLYTLECPQTIAERRWYGLWTRRRRCSQPGQCYVLEQ